MWVLYDARARPGIPQMQYLCRSPRKVGTSDPSPDVLRADWGPDPRRFGLRAIGVDDHDQDPAAKRRRTTAGGAAPGEAGTPATARKIIPGDGVVGKARCGFPGTLRLQGMAGAKAILWKSWML